MKTEDDTFKALQRVSYDEMCRILTNSIDSLDQKPLDKLFGEQGWSMRHYIGEFSKRARYV